MWTNFFIALCITVAMVSLMNRRETVNQTRFAVTCESKSDSARAFFDGLTKGLSP